MSTYAEKLRAKRVAAAQASAERRAQWRAAGCCLDCARPRRLGVYCDDCNARRARRAHERDQRIARFVGYRA